MIELYIKLKDFNLTRIIHILISNCSNLSYDKQHKGESSLESAVQLYNYVKDDQEWIKIIRVIINNNT